MENKIQIVFCPILASNLEGRHKEVRKFMGEEMA